MIDEQTLLVNTLGNGKRTAQRICILMLGCKWLLDELWSLLSFGPYFWIGHWMSIVVAQLKEKTSPIKTLIKTITKFLNVIGYHQPDWAPIGQHSRVMLVIGQWNRTVKGTVHISDACMCKWTECVTSVCCNLAFHWVKCLYFYENI